MRLLPSLRDSIPFATFDPPLKRWAIFQRCAHRKLVWLAEPLPNVVMQMLPHTRSCFVCGESNPLGLQLRFQTDGRTVRAEFTPRPEYSGFKHVVHGGIIATLLDEIMVWACAVQTKQFAFCAELNVRFQQPVHPNDKTVAQAELTSNRRNRIFEAKAELRDAQGNVLATATGKYLPIKSADASELMAELIGNLELFQSP